MKSLSEQIQESLSSKDERELKKLGFSKEVEGKKVWFQMTYKKQLIRIMQEEVGKDDWWLAKIESDFLLTADDVPATFETPLEAAEEAIDFLDKVSGNKK